MKIGNVSKLEPLSTSILLRDGVSITLEPLPLGFEQISEKEIPSPSPPRQVVMHNGKPLRDDKGRIIYEANTHDMDFKREESEVRQLQTVAMIYHSIKNDSNIQFDTPDMSDKKKFYESIYQELKDAGFNFQDFIHITRQITELNGMDEELLEKAKNSLEG